MQQRSATTLSPDADRCCAQFYTCGQEGTAWINRGNKLLSNTFRDIRTTDVTYLGFPSVQAIYLDDQVIPSAHLMNVNRIAHINTVLSQMSGWTIENNTVINAQMGLMVGGGRKNIVANNRFIGCDVAIHVDNRGMGSESVMCNNATGASCKC